MINSKKIEMNKFEIYREAYGNLNLRQLMDHKKILDNAINTEDDELFDNLNKPDLRIALMAVNSLIDVKANSV